MIQNPQPKNKLLLIALISLISIGLQAQNIGTLFLNMPDSYIPTLSQLQRFELLEYRKANRTDSTKNRFGNNVAIEMLDTANHLLKINTTATSKLEIKIIDKQTIGLIKTITKPIAVSKISFYDLNWKEKPGNFNALAPDQWLNADAIKKDNTAKELVAKAMETSFVSLSFTANGIEAKNNNAEFLSIEDQKAFSPYLIAKLVFVLKDNQWIVL